MGKIYLTDKIVYLATLICREALHEFYAMSDTRGITNNIHLTVIIQVLIKIILVNLISSKKMCDWPCNLQFTQYEYDKVYGKYHITKQVFIYVPSIGKLYKNGRQGYEQDNP